MHAVAVVYIFLHRSGPVSWRR